MHAHSGVLKIRQKLVGFLTVLLRLELGIPRGLPFCHEALHAIVVKISDIKRCHLLLLTNLSGPCLIWAESGNVTMLATREAETFPVSNTNRTTYSLGLSVLQRG